MEQTVIEQGSDAQNVTWLGLLVNIGLALFKGIAGVLAHSAAMIADAGHSLSDVLSDVVTLWAIRIARLPKDDNHPYGHGKFETIGALFVAFLLIATGIGIIIHSIEQIEHPVIPTNLALVAAALSILFKEILYQVTIYIAKRDHSRILTANAWHHRTDAISSVLALIGIAGAQFGMPILDPIAGILVAVWIMKTGATIGYDSIKELTDETIEEDLIPEIEELIKTVEGVEHYHNLRTRLMGPYVLVDIHIQVASRISVSVAHQIGERVRWTILQKISRINEVLVHIDAEDDDEGEAPLLMRPHQAVESDIRQKLDTIPEILEITHILCHFLQQRLSVQIEIVVDPTMRVLEVQKIAKKARFLVEQIEDVYSADIHLELEDS